MPHVCIGSWDLIPVAPHLLVLSDSLGLLSLFIFVCFVFFCCSGVLPIGMRDSQKLGKHSTTEVQPELHDCAF